MIRILFQGDSITDGNRYKNPEQSWDLNHQIGHSYVFSVVASLARKNPGKYTFINRGVSGDCINKLAERWQTDTLDQKPDILSILIGINGNGAFDGLYPEGADNHLASFEKQYRALLDSAVDQNPSLKIIIMEPFFLPVGEYKKTYNDFMKVFARKQEIIRRIAEDYNAVFIPVQERLESLVKESTPVLAENGYDKDPYTYWLWDGVHPTEAMHGYIAELWLEAAKDIL